MSKGPPRSASGSKNCQANRWHWINSPFGVQRVPLVVFRLFFFMSCCFLSLSSSSRAFVFKTGFKLFPKRVHAPSIGHAISKRTFTFSHVFVTVFVLGSFDLLLGSRGSFSDTHGCSFGDLGGPKGLSRAPFWRDVPWHFEVWGLLFCFFGLS